MNVGVLVSAVAHDLWGLMQSPDAAAGGCCPSYCICVLVPTHVTLVPSSGGALGARL